MSWVKAIARVPFLGLFIFFTWPLLVVAFVYSVVIIGMYFALCATIVIHQFSIMANTRLIVMIDDDMDDHQIFKMAVNDMDDPVNCLFFSDCESAIAHFSQEAATPPKIVFIDLKLPRIDGDQCLWELKQLRQFDAPSLIVYSSSIPDNWRSKLLEIGVDKIIEKTDSIPELTGHIQAAVNMR